VPLSARDTYRSILSMTLVTRPPSLYQFYDYPRCFVNPVTIEPQHLEYRNPWHPYIRTEIQVGLTMGLGAARNIRHEFWRYVSAWPMLVIRSRGRTQSERATTAVPKLLPDY
jgi:hypothetical protein